MTEAEQNEVVRYSMEGLSANSNNSGSTILLPHLLRCRRGSCSRIFGCLRTIGGMNFELLRPWCGLKNLTR